MWRLAGVSSIALLVGSCPSPRGRGATVEFYLEEGYRFSPAERRVIERIVHDTVSEVRPMLPALPDEIVVRVRAGSDVIPEAGQTGSHFPPRVVAWHVNPRHPGGVTEVARTWLRACLYHELHHLVRHTTVPFFSLRDRVVSEGLATAFERDFAGTSPPWGAYTGDASLWAQELLSLPLDADAGTWMHSDGRRWIGWRTGTYLVDRARRASGNTSADLVQRSTEDILAMAASSP